MKGSECNRHETEVESPDELFKIGLVYLQKEFRRWQRVEAAL